MLLIITPNPSLDRTMVVPGMRLGAVLRAERTIAAAGGKGLNVARAARTLGAQVKVLAPLGGLTGRMVAGLAAAEGLDADWHWHEAGETRTCVLVVDPQGNDATALNEPGPLFSTADWQAFTATIHRAAAGAALIAVCGSLPPGVAPAAFTTLLQTLAADGHRIIVDISSPALEAALAASPYAIKVNGSELGTALGQPVRNPAEAAAALAHVHKCGITLAVVSLGAQGALASDQNGCLHAQPPDVSIVSSVGSGDSLLAGLACALLRGDSLAEALRLGVACGTADALTIGGGLIVPETLNRIITGVTLTKMT